jgi:hypothetical protein
VPAVPVKIVTGLAGELFSLTSNEPSIITYSNPMNEEYVSIRIRAGTQPYKYPADKVHANK